MRLRSICIFLGVIATVAFACAANAQVVLPGATYYANVSSGSAQREFTAPGTYAFDGASLTVAGFPLPSLLGIATSATGASASFSGDISYSFTVDGPASGIVVPLFAVYVLHASAIGTASSAIASFSLTGTRNDFFERIAADGAFSTQPDLLATRPVGLEPGRVGLVSLGIGGVSFSALAADAYADPFIYVDPLFLASHPGYSVRVSGGIGNTAPAVAVPEPETWAMLLVGLAALATARARARDASPAT